MVPSELTITTSTAESMINRMVAEQQKLLELQQLASAAGLGLTPTLSSQALLSISGPSQTRSQATLDSLIAVAQRVAEGPAPIIDIDIDAPQGMSPDQLASATASRTAYALSGMTTPIPRPVGSTS